MLVTSGVCEKHEDANGDSILSGFGSSSGSSTDEACEEEEFLDELTRQMAENMLQDDGDNQGKKDEQREVKEHVDGRRAGFVSPNGSGMRVVFLGENGSAGGTGVFIPHATSTLPNHQLRRKPGRCSRVLIPERVLNSLKQHHEKRNASQAHSNAQRLQHQGTPNKAVVNNHQETPNKSVVNDDDDDDDDDLQLPREWTY